MRNSNKRPGGAGPYTREKANHYRNSVDSQRQMDKINADEVNDYSIRYHLPCPTHLGCGVHPTRMHVPTQGHRCSLIEQDLHATLNGSRLDAANSSTAST